MPMFLALNIWMNVSRRMVSDWRWSPAETSTDKASPRTRS